jgi:Cu-processing system permease protein
MKIALALAVKEFRDALRNRWVAASVLLLALLATLLALLGTAPGGTVDAGALEVTIASLSSLSVYLLPLIALLLSYDTLVGEAERGTLLLLLSYPVARWQVVIGKALGHTAILGVAILLGYGGVGAVLAIADGASLQSILAYLGMMASTLALGVTFVGLGALLSALAGERATAAGLAIALWLVMVVLYDLALLGLLMADDGAAIGGGLFQALLLVNPTDAYRMIALTGVEAVRDIAGLSGLEGGPSLAISLGVLGLWLVLPIAATVAVFSRKEV